MTVDKAAATPSANFTGSVKQTGAMNEYYGPSSSSTPSASSHTKNANSPTQTVNVMKKNRNDVIKTIQEIAKVDEFTINQAIEACQDNEGRYSMDQVLNILMDENSIGQQNQQNQEILAIRNSLSKNSASAGIPTSSQSGTEKYHLNKSRDSAGCESPIDQNNEYGMNTYGVDNQNLNLEDEDDDFETPNLQSNSSMNQFLVPGSTSSFKNSPASLTEILLRDECQPVGLKNVGNTCWFNSIIQAFFHLPYFRDLILSFQIGEFYLTKLDENSRNVVNFILELRKLFALMLKSKRKSINPSPTLRFLKMCSKYDSELFNQEDVSEFATILVNLIEESFDILAKQKETEDNNSEKNITITPSLNSSAARTTPSTDTLIPIQIISSSSLSSSVADCKMIDTTEEKFSLLSANQINLRIKNRKNPIVKLLNGDMLINRKKSDEDLTTSMIEIFREVNIQMLNARNLHAGLELEWGETSIDKLIAPNNSQLNKVQSDHQGLLNKSIYQQESWIAQLPSVLFICLNRYKFVKATQSSAKILEPFEFDEQIYLDRYMYTNREIVKTKRKELNVLNGELKKLEEKLNSIKCYRVSQKAGCRQTSYALDDVLKCALDFAASDQSLSEVFSSIKPTEGEEGIDVVNETEKVQLVKACLRNWIDGVEKKLEDLQSSIKEVKNRIDNIFDVESLKKIRYNLHSVCIHEGNAMSGHFWTYIWNPQQLKWYKYNDTEVSESNWNDLYANAIGGSLSNFVNNSETKETVINQDSFLTAKSELKSNQQPSAYFLIYVKADDQTLYEEKPTLTVDLTKLLASDQENLKNQIVNIRLKQLYRECVESLRKSNQLIAEANLTSANPINDQNNQTCIEHAKTFKDSTYESFKASFDLISTSKDGNCPTSSSIVTVINCGLEAALNNAIETELNKYTETSADIIANLPDYDLRTNHMLTYLSCNNVPREIRVIALLDLFRIQIFTENSLRVKLMQILAQIKFNQYILAALDKPSDSLDTSAVSAVYRSYEKWQNDYRDYRSIIAAFINAANFMDTQKYEEAATFYCVAVEYNERITAGLTCKMKGMDHEFLLINRRKCLKLWNECVLRKFSTNSGTGELANMLPTDLLDRSPAEAQSQPMSQMEMTSLIELMMSKFLPCFFRLSNPNSTPEDKAMIDEIRQDWLSVLDSNLPELQVFHDFMAKLFEDQFVNHFHSLNVNKTMLSVRYRDVVQFLKNIRIN